MSYIEGFKNTVNLREISHAEHHFNKYPDHPWLKEKDEIVNWLNEHTNVILSSGAVWDGWSVSEVADDLTVSIDGVVSFNKPSGYINSEETHYSYIRVQFKNVKDFIFARAGLRSAIGTPYFCENVLDLSYNSIKSFLGITSNAKYINIAYNPIQSFDEFPGQKNSNCKLFLSLDNIKSWDGLKDIQDLYIYEENENIDLIKKLPANINTLSINRVKSNRENYSMFKFIRSNNSELSNKVDMRWFRKYQRRENSYCRNLHRYIISW